MKEFYKEFSDVDPALLIPKPIEALRPVITSYLNDDGEDFDDILTRYEMKDEVTCVANW